MRNFKEGGASELSQDAVCIASIYLQINKQARSAASLESEIRIYKGEKKRRKEGALSAAHISEQMELAEMKNHQCSIQLSTLLTIERQWPATTQEMSTFKGEDNGGCSCCLTVRYMVMRS